jgi:hypothetical protein
MMEKACRKQYRVQHSCFCIMYTLLVGNFNKVMEIRRRNSNSTENPQFLRTVNEVLVQNAFILGEGRKVQTIYGPYKSSHILVRNSSKLFATGSEVHTKESVASSQSGRTWAFQGY